MKKKYLYYDKKTGLIKEILSNKKQGSAPYIECDNSEVEGFIMGTKGVYNYIVIYKEDIDKHILIEKNNVIGFRKQSKNLYKIPYKKSFQSDLKISYYPDNTIEVSIDMSRISPLYQTDFRNDVRFERGTEIRIFLKKKDTGELVRELIIDAQELLHSAQIVFELDKSISHSNIEFFTYKLFNTYSWSKESLRLTSPLKEKIKFDIHKADTQVKSTKTSHHLIIEPTGKGIKIKNNIDNPKLIRFHKKLEFFIVDKHDPNILYEKFFLNEEDLSKEVIEVDLKTEVDGKSILYNNKHLSVLIKGKL